MNPVYHVQIDLNFYFKQNLDYFILCVFFLVEKHDHTSQDKSAVNPVILTDVNPAYGEVKNTDTTRTVYDTVQ